MTFQDQGVVMLAIELDKAVTLCSVWPTIGEKSGEEVVIKKKIPMNSVVYFRTVILFLYNMKEEKHELKWKEILII